MTDQVTIGLERCLAEPPDLLRGARFGLLSNQASVDRRFRYAHQLLAERFPGQLRALFGPQHGLWSEQQDNMVETAHGRDAELQLPVHSLYADRPRPSRDQLRGLDLLVVDLQNVGTRVYTYSWTVSYCLEACAEAGIPLLVLDRPNPVGGLLVEGPRLDPLYSSFVGRHPIPMRHGLTMAEMARYLNRAMGIDAEIDTVPMQGWHRGLHFTETGRTWLPASPNLPRIEGVDLYPGQVLVEGTNLSEGRGTTTPFEVIGAPFIDPPRLIEAIGAYDLPGVVFRPIRFEPTFHKWCGTSCGGLHLHVVDRRAMRPYRTAVALLAAIGRLWPDAFAWTAPPYEYETEKRPIDILAGSPGLREAIDAGLGPDEVSELAHGDQQDDWWAEVDDALLYSSEDAPARRASE
ncbi:MAG: exo-beta-N-acetylmuramidase NamZ domain-containing protein [Pirellulales bacterium]